jgi:hypothetical protein
MKHFRPILSVTLLAPKPLLLQSTSLRTPLAQGRTARRSRPLLLLALLSMLLAVQTSHAQDVSTYQLAATAGTFTPITGGTPVTVLAQAGQELRPPSLPYHLPFTTAAPPLLRCRLPAGATLRSPRRVMPLRSTTFAMPAAQLAPLWDELSGVGGTASYVVTGTAPNRVFTF